MISKSGCFSKDVILILESKDSLSCKTSNIWSYSLIFKSSNFLPSCKFGLYLFVCINEIKLFNNFKLFMTSDISKCELISKQRYEDINLLKLYLEYK